MGKKSMGGSAYIDSVVVDGVRISVMAGATRENRDTCVFDLLDANLRAESAEFELERSIDVGTSEVPNPVRIRSTGRGIDLIRGHIARLEERALQAEANLRDANARCRQFEKHAERADWIAGELRRDEFQYQDSIPVDEMSGKRILVQVRGTEGGIKRIKAFIAREEHASDKLHESLLAAEARIKALEAEKADALASVAGLEGPPTAATTYTVSHGGATMTVTGSPSGVANVVKLAYGGFEYGMSA